jgi:hypothetical protein
LQEGRNHFSDMETILRTRASIRTVLLLAAFALAAVTNRAAAQPSPPVAGTQTQSPVQPFADQSFPSLDYPLVWNDILGPLSAPPGWRVESCEGRSPFLCICSAHSYVGGVELLTYPLERMPRFCADLAVSPDGGVSALEALANDFLQSLEKDRKSGFAGAYVFSAVTPERVAVGKLPGIRYGFSGFRPDGRLLERSVHYTTFDSNAVYTIVARAVSPPPRGQWMERHGEFVDEDLRQFEPSFAEIVRALHFPLTARRFREEALTKIGTEGETTRCK